MRRSIWWSTALAVSVAGQALADEADLKQQVDRISSAYAESFNKQDPAGIAALFATPHLFVTAAGPNANIAQAIAGTFKAGFDQAEVKVDQVWPLGADAAIGTGQIRLVGKNPSGAPMEASLFWTATYVQEGGKWKIRMLSGIPKAPPPQAR